MKIENILKWFSECFSLLRSTLLSECQKIWDIVQRFLSLRYLDLAIILISFCILEQIEYESIIKISGSVYRWESDLAPVAVQNFCVVCIPLVLLTGKWRKCYAVLLAIFWLLPIAAQIFLLKNYWLAYEKYTFTLLWTASPDVALTFLATFNIWDWLGIIGSILGLIFFCCIFCYQKTQKRNVTDFCIAFLLFLPMCVFYLQHRDNSPEESRMVTRISGFPAMIRGVVQCHREIKKVQEYINNPVLPEGTTRDKKMNDVLCFIFIGESATRGRTSLYGYPHRKTTPYLDALKPELILFQNAISSAVTTNESHLNMFSVRPQLADEPTGTLDNYLRKSNIKTTYVTSFLETGWSRYSYITHMLFSTTDFIRPDGDIKKAYDENIVVMLNEMLDKENLAGQVIYLHGAGCHVDFSTRFPPQHAVFSMVDHPTLLDYYDDALHYTDYVLGKLIETLKKIDQPICFFYVSDHGETVYDGIDEATWKNRRRDIPASYEVPMFLWINDKYKELYPDIIKNAKANTNKAFSTETIAYSLLSLAGITYKNFPDELNIFSDKFKSQEYLPHWKRYEQYRKNFGRR